MRVTSSQFINYPLALMGVAVLLLGSSVYLLDRPVAGLPYLPNYFSGTLELPLWLSVLGHYLPAFAHPLGFTLLSLAVVDATRLNTILICSFWGGLNFLVEYGQQAQFAWLHQWMQDSEGVMRYPLNSLGCLLANGHYDLADMMAILFGTLFAVGFTWKITESGGSR